LKYGEGGHYVPHVDHGHDVPRTLSIIYFLNNDYEGGDLRFHNPDKNSEVYKTVTSAPGRVIIWPSNFLYPHSVTPVTKGKRFVLVSWLL
jgi:predicted 2-oxoglutarate/Fe(II)-dependent dioxygenase YbiX